MRCYRETRAYSSARELADLALQVADRIMPGEKSGSAARSTVSPGRRTIGELRHLNRLAERTVCTRERTVSAWTPSRFFRTPIVRLSIQTVRLRIEIVRLSIQTVRLRIQTVRLLIQTVRLRTPIVRLRAQIVLSRTPIVRLRLADNSVRS